MQSISLSVSSNRRAFVPRASSAMLAALPALLLLAAAARPLPAQLSVTKVLDSSALRPPAGIRVAIVEFDDLQCPSCAHYNPVLRQAAEHYKIPLIQHDFIIPYHNWSRSAAIDARWLDAHSKALGEEFRDAVFSNQPFIYNQGALNQFAQKFARDHGISMPFNVDPSGKLEAEVTADTDLGKRTGVNGTPTIFVVSAGPRGPSYTQILDVDRDLYRTIDQALAQTRAH
jgi:protein-disulfide isomerase